MGLNLILFFILEFIYKFSENMIFYEQKAGKKAW
jgi:hypothetical protein